MSHGKSYPFTDFNHAFHCGWRRTLNVLDSFRIRLAFFILLGHDVGGLATIQPAEVRVLRAGLRQVLEAILPLAFYEEMPPMERVLASARLFLAIAFLAAICADPAQPRRYVNLAYIPLIAYVFYSCGLFVLILLHKDEKFTRPFILGAHTADLCWPGLFAVSTVSPESPFYLPFSSRFSWQLAVADFGGY